MVRAKNSLTGMGSRPEWCISSKIHGGDTTFWSETLDCVLSVFLCPQSTYRLSVGNKISFRLKRVSMFAHVCLYVCLSLFLFVCLLVCSVLVDEVAFFFVNCVLVFVTVKFLCVLKLLFFVNCVLVFVPVKFFCVCFCWWRRGGGECPSV